MIDIRYIDNNIFHFINSTLSNPLFDVVMPFVTNNPGLLLLPVLVLFMVKDRRIGLYAIVVSLFALATSDAMANSLKHIIQRPRPFMVLQDVITLVGRGKSFSMPSAHAANITSVVTVFIYLIGRLGRTKLGKAAIVYLLAVAVTVSFSRIYVGVHYPTDVFAGMLLGLFSGVAMITIAGWTGSAFRQKRYGRLLFLLLVILSLFRLYYIQTGPLDLSPDEAQYWDWSRRLDLSYYSKGPAIAYLIKAGTLLLGDTELGVRLPAVVLSLLSSIVLFYLTRSILNRHSEPGSRMPDTAAFVVASLLQIIPIFATYGVVMTIDSPFIFFWALSLYLFWHCQKDWPLRQSGLFVWILLGIAVGCGVLTKYTMAFFYLSAFLYLLTDRERRGILLGPGPWMALFVSLIVSSPIIIWNAEHNWVTFLHTAGQAHLQDGLRLRPDRFIEFILSQLGVITPVIMVFMIVALMKFRKGEADRRFLFWFAAPTVLFFLLKSLQGKVQANWALPGYISAVVAMGIYVVQRWPYYRKLIKLIFIAGTVMAFLVTAVAHYPGILKLPPKQDPSSRLRGWEPLGEEVSRLMRKMDKPLFIFSNRYQVTAELAFYVEGQPVTYCVNLGRRMNQYDLWPGFHSFKGYNAIFVRWGDKKFPDELKSRFDRYEKRLLTVKENGRVLRKYSIFLCYNFKGMQRRLPDRY